MCVVGRLKAKEYSFVHEDISTVVRECESEYIPVKVILETCLLTPEEIIAASVIAREVCLRCDRLRTPLQSSSRT
jgi:deoxyribose-phosphate aldolase